MDRVSAIKIYYYYYYTIWTLTLAHILPMNMDNKYTNHRMPIDPYIILN